MVSLLKTGRFKDLPVVRQICLRESLVTERFSQAYFLVKYESYFTASFIFASIMLLATSNAFVNPSGFLPPAVAKKG